MNARKIASMLLAVALTSSWCLPLIAADLLEERVDRLVQPYLENEVVVGMTIGVLHRGEVDYFGYGRRSEKDVRKPDGNTIYEIGSMSKVFTGLLLADAVIEGHVRLDQSAGELLPADVKMPSKGERAITLQDLSTHVSGLPRLPDNLRMSDLENPYVDYTVENLHVFLNGHKLSRSPGEESEYSNLGQGLLGHLLALRENATYEHLLRTRIALPLKMENTTIGLSEAQQRQLAAPHMGDGQRATNWDLPTLAGAGAIRSTASDLLLFANANLTPPDDKLGEAIQLAWKVHQEPLNEGGFALGLGWHVAKDGVTRWHNGQTGGYHSMIFVSREMETSVVLLTNTSTTEVDKLAQDILLMLSGAEVEPREFEKSLSVSAEIMSKYVGSYQLAPGYVFTVSLKDDKLMVGLTGQPTFQVYARSETEWFYKVVKATLTFKVDDEGICNAVELFQNGVRQEAKRID